MLVSFDLIATAGVAPLTGSLPNGTSIYHDWPPDGLRVSLPKYHRVATAVPTTSDGDGASSWFLQLPDPDGRRLMSQPVHVRDGDFLSVKMTNGLMATGLSIHWHGFEMTGHLELDGVVGITQCPISPGESFTYAWEVEETPGTYWYHTHSGDLGIDAYNGIMGPLIVHPKISAEEEETLSSSSEVPFLDPAAYAQDPRAQEKMSVEELLFYGNERILFFGDGFLHSGAHHLLEKVGGLNPPISHNDDKFSVGTSPWNFGTTNGKLREVVPVSPGQSYKFRLLNAGTMYALRIAFDGYRMEIVAADSEPVEPVITDEVILHAAERFDITLKIPADATVGSTSWIRADTLESRKQGYQNGIRAILHIVPPNSSPGASPVDVPDPFEPIETTTDHNSRLTYNCYSQRETEEASGQGGCIPVSSLQLKNGGETHGAISSAKAYGAPVESHVVDWQFSASPQFAHFVRIDGGLWYQFQMFAGHSMMLPDYNAEEMLHPHGAMLNVDMGVGAIIIWRNKSAMDHPIHLHGRKVEVLEEHILEKEVDCDLVKCPLAGVFNSDEKIQELSEIAFGSRPLKDTFILPAGGAVATRFFTGDPALWFSHCHLEVHREDGMAFIVNVGNYQAPRSSDWLPSDYPKCDTPFLLSKKDHPACDCYINEDAVMGNSLTGDHRCSRDYLCFHANSPQTSLKDRPYHSGGVGIRSQYPMPAWSISLIIVVVVMIISCSIAYRNRLVGASRDTQSKCDPEPATELSPSVSRIWSSMNLTNGMEKAVIDTGVVVEKIDTAESSGVAVLLINFQNEFMKGGFLYDLAKVDLDNKDVLSRTNQLIAAAREKGALIIHVPTVLKEEDDPDMSKYSTTGELFKEGTWNCEETITHGEGDFVIPTKTTNAFTPKLESFLEEKNIKILFVCGFLLEVGVRDTVMSASEKLNDEVEIFVVEDCCVSGTRTKGQMEHGIAGLQMLANFTKSQKFGLNAAESQAHLSKSAIKTHKSNHTKLLINTVRSRPTTMDLPGSGVRRKSRNSTRIGRMSRLSRLSGHTGEYLPVAAKDFKVPERRTELDFEVEGFNVRGSVSVQEKTTGNLDEQSPFMEQFMFFARSQWKLYRPTCISLLRVGEVTSLAFFTGFLFYKVGDNYTATGFGSINSLLFFSVTLWTFTRMYPAINTHYDWNQKLTIIANEHRFALAPACLARCVVVHLAELGWPFIYVFVCYPMASMAGSWNAMFRIALMLFLNNSCYISLGACLGVLVPKIPQGMIISTVAAQSSLVAAGFYTEVPSVLAWLRYISPVFWTYRGIVKSAFHWSDTFQCRWGSQLAGVNSCFIEFHTAINNLKERGINVATFGDKESTKIWLECIVLTLIFSAMQGYMFCLIFWRQRQEDWFELHFERLCEYHSVYGTTSVPEDYTSGDNVRLGLFVKSMKDKKKTMKKERIERLEELGFVWD